MRAKVNSVPEVDEPTAGGTAASVPEDDNLEVGASPGGDMTSSTAPVPESDKTEAGAAPVPELDRTEAGAVDIVDRPADTP